MEITRPLHFSLPFPLFLFSSDFLHHSTFPFVHILLFLTALYPSYLSLLIFLHIFFLNFFSFFVVLTPYTSMWPHWLLLLVLLLPVSPFSSLMAASFRLRIGITMLAGRQLSSCHCSKTSVKWMSGEYSRCLPEWCERLLELMCIQFRTEVTDKDGEVTWSRAKQTYSRLSGGDSSYKSKTYTISMEREFF